MCLENRLSRESDLSGREGNDKQVKLLLDLERMGTALRIQTVNKEVELEMWNLLFPS